MGNAVAAGGDGGMHVLMFPSVAFGHISPFVQLARKLVAGDGMRVTLLSAAANLPRVEAMLASDAGEVVVAPLYLPFVPGLPEGAESTAEVSAGGAELLKVALDGTRPQVAALLAELRPDAIVYDFATPCTTGMGSYADGRSLRRQPNVGAVGVAIVYASFAKQPSA